MKFFSNNQIKYRDIKNSNADILFSANKYLNKSKLPNLDNCKVAILGLGYVGLPLAIAIAKKKNCLLTKNKFVITVSINGGNAGNISKALM